MKLFTIKTFCLSLLLVAALLSGCKKWLDVRPSAQIKQDELFENELGFKDALLGVYSKMTSRDLYSDNLTMGFLDVLAQRYSIGNAGHKLYYAARYDYQNVMVRARIDAIWGAMYNTIANTNNILGHLDDDKSIFSGENYALIKGESLGLRAFMHFDLLRMFAPAYSKGAGLTAIPYVTQFSTSTTPLSTIAEVLDQVILDLKTAEGLLEKSDPINGGPAIDSDLGKYRANRMNYFAVKALLARVYLYKNDPVNAAIYARSVVAGKKYEFITGASLTGVRKDRTFSTEHLFSLYANKLNEPVLEYFKFRVAGIDATDLNHTESTVKTAFEVNSGGSTDFRYVYLWEMDQSTKFHSKFWQEYSSAAINGAMYIKLVPLIRISEMYYILAECEKDPAAAIGYLNEVRSHRGLAALPTNFTLDGVREEIMKEYRKEFFSEGQLFFYYKRFNYAKIPGSTMAATDKVYVLPMPDNEIEFRNK